MGRRDQRRLRPRLAHRRACAAEAAGAAGRRAPGAAGVAPPRSRNRPGGRLHRRPARGLDRWPPWIEGDFDKDGKDDIAAVVVRGGGARELEFTVIAVHAARPGRAELVVPFGRAAHLRRLRRQFEDDTVTPMRCVECDCERLVSLERPCLRAVAARRRGNRADLRRARPAADAVRRPAPRCRTGRPRCRSVSRPRCCRCAAAKDNAGIASRSDAPSSPRGWIPEQLVVEDVDCSS